MILRKRGEAKMLSPDTEADAQMGFVSSTCDNGKFNYKSDGTIRKAGSSSSLCLSVESAPFFKEADMSGKKLLLRDCKYFAHCNDIDNIVFLVVLDY